ncbi:MAG: hypothetical protein WCR24_05860 [Candidatus Methanomethylophilaceae archaeon]
METKYLMAIAITAIVIIAGSGVAIIISGNNSNNSSTSDTTRLMIYGNSDLDDDLDSDDITMLQAIIDGTEEATDYSDANCDGVINSDDISVINKLIAGESTVAYYNDSTNGATAVNFPITSIMGIHQYVLIPLCAIDALQYMDGYVMFSNDATMLSELYSTQTNVNSSYNSLNIEKFASLTEKPDYLITYNDRLSNEAKITKMGSQVIHLPFDGIEDSPSAILTIGFLLNLYDNAKEYVDFVDELLNNIKTEVTNILTADERVKVMCGYMTDCIDNNDGIYTTAAIAAGGVSVTDWTGTYREFSKGDEWIYDYDCEYFFYFNSWGYTENIDLPGTYNKSADYFTGLAAYKNNDFTVLNSIMPVPLMVAYIAEALFPDYVGDGYGDSFNQRYIEKFFPEFAVEFDVSDYNYMITYDDLHTS